MARIDRRSLQTNPQVQPLAEGVGRAANDREATQRFISQELAKRQWQVYEGSVVMAIPQLGWHMVAVEGLGGLVAAQSLGQADVWGTQTNRALQNGTSVIVACQAKSHSAVIMGEVPREVSDPGHEFVQASFAGSWSGLKRDPAAQQFVELTGKNAKVAGAQTNSLWDQHAGDWSVRSNLGSLILVDNFSVRLATDETTEIYLDLLEQSLCLQSRKFTMQSDGFAMQDDYGGKFACMAMGESVYQSQSPLKTKAAEDKEYRQTLAGWMIDLLEEDSPAETFIERRCWQLLVTPQQTLGQTHYGKAHLSVTPYGTHLISGQISGIVSDLPAYSEYREPGTPKPDEFDERPKDLSETAETVLGDKPRKDLPASIRPLQEILKHYAAENHADGQFGEVERYGFRVSDTWLPEDKQPPLESDIAEAVKKYESFIRMQHLTEDAEPYFSPAVAGDTYLPAGIHVDKETGDISLFNEHGAGIRIVGTSVYIEGLQVRVSATKDVVVLGRDVQLLGNRNATVSANKNLRIYSQKNLLLLSGNSGEGGTLIENRSTSSDQNLPEDPEQAVYSGINLKAVRSHVATLGGGVLIKAGDADKNVSGDLVMLSDTGNLYMSGRQSFVQHTPNNFIHAFGSTRSQISAVNVFARQMAILSGQLKASTVWSSGDVIARSNIQAVTGRLGDSAGQTPGRVTADGRLRVSSALSQFDQTQAQARSSSQQVFSTLQRAFMTGKKVLASDTFVELSTAYAKEGTLDSAYGVRKLQTTFQHEFRQSLEAASLKDFQFQVVSYKGDASSGLSTHGWPGRLAEVYRGRASGEARTGKLVTDWAGKQATPAATVSKAPVTPSQLFKTLDGD